jgi:hypothetical protein
VTVDDLLRAKRVDDPAEVVDRISHGAKLIVPIANGEPVTLLDIASLDARLGALLIRVRDWQFDAAAWQAAQALRAPAGGAHALPALRTKGAPAATGLKAW